MSSDICKLLLTTFAFVNVSGTTEAPIAGSTQLT